MPGPKTEPIELTETQETMLEQLVRRSHIILAANERIAHPLVGLTCRTVRMWRNRWAEASENIAACEAEEKEKDYRHKIVNLLSNNPRSGTLPTFSAEQICQIVALACEHPSQSGCPITHWTPRELADETKYSILDFVPTCGVFFKISSTLNLTNIGIGWQGG